MLLNMSFVQATNQGTDLRQSPLAKYTSVHIILNNTAAQAESFLFISC